MVGTIFFNQQPLVYFSYILIFVTWYVLFHTRHRAGAPRGRRAPGGGLRARDAGQPPALRLHRDRRRAGRHGGGVVFAGDQAGLVNAAGDDGRRLDCAGDCDFRRLASVPGRAGRVPVRRAALAVVGDSAQPRREYPAGAAQRLALGAAGGHAGDGEQRRD